jgi:predicted ester cyclase
MRARTRSRLGPVLASVFAAAVLGVAVPPAADSASRSQLDAFARRFTDEVYNQKRKDKIRDYVHPQFVDHSPGAPPDARGPEFVEKQWASTFAAFPDLKFAVEDVLVDGDKVVIRWVSTGTFTGTLGEVAGRGQAVTVHGISIFRMQDGKIAESWDLVDRLAMLRQAGFAVTPPKAE